MINSLQLWPQFRDTWGFYDAMVNQYFAGLDHNPCYRPKFIEVPEVGLQIMRPGAVLQYDFTVAPGSLILGFGNDDNAALFSVQIRDESTGLRFWDDPVSNWFLTNNWGEYPSLLCMPRPVVGNGKFRAELYCDPSNAVPVRCGFSVWVAEVTECQ